LMEMTEAGDIMMRFDSIHHLIAGASAVITINSGVGSETLLHRKPLYCLGASDYDCVAHRISSVEQFTELTTPIRHAVSETDYIRFSAYYRKDYLVEWTQPGRLDAAIQQRVIDPVLAGR
jgi:capsule polysaccharide modification protein KpsS